VTDPTTPARGNPADLGDPHIPAALAYFAAPRGRGHAKGPTGPLEPSDSPWAEARPSTGPNDPCASFDLTEPGAAQARGAAAEPGDAHARGASIAPADAYEPGEPPASTDTCTLDEPTAPIDRCTSVEPTAPNGPRTPGKRTDAPAPRATGSTSRHTPAEPNTPYPPGDSTSPAHTSRLSKPPAPDDTCTSGAPTAPNGPRTPGERIDAHARRATGSTSRYTPAEPNTPHPPSHSTGPAYTYQLADPVGPQAPGNPAGPSDRQTFGGPTTPNSPAGTGQSEPHAPAGPHTARNVCQDLHDRVELRQLVDTYAYALDRRMAELFGSLFAADGELVLLRAGGRDLVFDGRDGWARALAVLEPCRVTTHFVGNHLVRLDGDSATGETYCLAHEIYPTDGADRMRVRSIRYRDSYRRTEGSWLFTRRELTIDWTEDRVLRSPAGP